jgi:hypothetical protein
MVESAKDFPKALEKKGFRLERRTKDKSFYFYYQGRKTQIHTKISEGKSEDLRNTLLAKIKQQMCLDSTGQVSSFIDCSLDEPDYIKLLIAKGLLRTQESVCAGYFDFSTMPGTVATVRPHEPRSVACGSATASFSWRVARDRRSAAHGRPGT